MREAQEEDKSMKDEYKKRGRDQRTEADLEEQARKYATVEVEENKGSIKSMLWVCSYSHNQDFHDDISGKKLKT